MIDVTREISKFKPIDLNFIPGRYAPTSDQMYDAFVLYNKALHQIQLDKEDAAKNFLRKATALFSDFYEANMVLGILVFASGDRIGAVRIFNSISDNSKREDAIKFLDHLVQEAEKPETAKASSKTSFADRHMVNSPKTERTVSGRATERDVLGDRNNHEENVHGKTDEARYSRGRVFEKGGNFYEPQGGRRSSNVPQKRYGNSRRNVQIEENDARVSTAGMFVDETNNRNTSRSDNFGQQKRRPNSDIKTSRPNTPEEKSGGKFFREQLKDVNDLKFLNKCLIIIIAILLLFTVIMSTIVVNRTAEVRRLNDELVSITSGNNNLGDAD